MMGSSGAWRIKRQLHSIYCTSAAVSGMIVPVPPIAVRRHEEGQDCWLHQELTSVQARVLTRNHVFFVQRKCI